MNTALVPIEQRHPDPWARCIGMFLQSVRDRSESTYENYTSTLRMFFTMFAGRQPDCITREDVERFVHRPCQQGRKKGEPPSAATRNTRLSILSAFYKFASMYTYTSDGKPTRLFAELAPTAGIRPSKVIRPRRVLSESELERLFAVMPKNTVQGLRDRSIFTLLLLTGRRLGEAINLRYGDIEWGPISEEDGSTRTGWVYSWDGEKGQRGQRLSSELPVLAKVLIDEYLEASGRLPLEADAPLWIAVGAPTLQHAPLGLPYDPYKPISRGAVQDALRKYARAAGLADKQISPHWLRHSNAKARYAADKNIIKVMKALGQSDLQSTYIYLQNLLGNADQGARELAHTFKFLLK